MLDRAFAFAAECHNGHFRKGAARIPYIAHPAEVVNILRAAGIVDIDILAAAYLHDVIEDCGVNRAGLAAMFNDRVAGIVAEVSNDPALDGPAAKAAMIAKAPGMSDDAKLVKLADRIANMGDVIDNPPGWNRLRKIAYFNHGAELAAGLRGINPDLDAAFYRVYNRIGEIV